MANNNRNLWLSLACLLTLAWSTARAQGEQRLDEPGMRWVNPVELLGLKGMHLNTTQRTYYQGDVDVEQIIRKSGTPILGMKLRPLVAAVQVDELCRLMLKIERGENSSFHVDYTSLNGVKGVPLHEKSFCLYPEDYYDVDYEFSYSWGGNCPQKNRDGEMEMMSQSATSEVEMYITDFYLREHDDKGWAVGYVLDVEENVKMQWSDGDTNRARWTYRNNDERKPMLTRYIYFTNSNQLILMISADASKMKFNLEHEEEEKYADYPWARVYFVVEEVMVYEDQLPPDDPSNNPGDDPNNPDDDPNNPGDDPDDPGDDPDDSDDSLLKLDTHADPVESVVINSVGTLVSIAVGAGIANTVTSVLSGGAGGGGGVPPTSPDLPDMPDTDGIEPDPDPKEPEPDPEDPDEPEQPEDPEDPEQPKEDEDEEKKEYEQEEPDPNKFVPKRYPDQCKGRVTQQPDGDIIVRDPETGKETMHFYPNGDGTWFTNTTVGKPDQYVTQEEIEDRIRFEADNSDYVKDVADKAATAVKQQHEDLEKYIKDAEKKGYTDEEYHEWKKQWEKEERHQDVLNKLALKYYIADSSDEKAIRKAVRTPVIKIETDQAIKDLKWATAKDFAYSVGIFGADAVDKTCETTVYAMGAAMPGGGSAVRDVYIVMRSTGIASQEMQYIRDPDKALAHSKAGFTKGVITMMFSGHSGELSQGFGGGIYSEGLMYIGSEGVNGAITGNEDGTGIVSGAAKGMGKKAIAFGIAKGTGAILKKAVSDGNVVKGLATATAKGGMNAYSFATKTVPDTWKSAKRFIQVMQM